MRLTVFFRDIGLSGTNFWCLWTILFVTLICILVFCFLKFNNEEPNNRNREFQSRRPGRTYVATDQYPGPPIDGQVRQLGNTRLPSYNKAVRHQGRNCRTPPPDYPKNPYQGPSNFLDSLGNMKSIMDSFMSWYSNENEETSPTQNEESCDLTDSRIDRLDEIQEEPSTEQNASTNVYKVV